ncbi:MAG: hypothetical protein DMG77_16605 [Acidobacteria bacterium]|nr:MAG: hypothetical protein DMG77_16605 [Acidobacteriota bacterium]
MTIAERVSNFLRDKHPGTSYCDDCIAKQLDLSRRQQAQRVTIALAVTKDFVRQIGTCPECKGRDKFVTRSV